MECSQGRIRTLTNGWNAHEQVSIRRNEVRVQRSGEQVRRNPEVVGSNPTLVRVFLCACVGPIPALGLFSKGVIENITSQWC